MSVNDSIDDLVTDEDIVVTRTAPGMLVDGVYVRGATSTFFIDAVVQPAFNLNRVVGGSNLIAGVDGQKATDVQQLHTRTELLALVPGISVPDVLTFRGADWTVARSEAWNLDGELHWHCVISKVTGGAS